MSSPSRPEVPRAGTACRGALSDDLGWAIGTVFRAYVKAANAAFCDLPGGLRGYQVLRACARSDPRSQLELASHLGVDRTVMTYLLDDLERAGLIERHPDPADRRARRIVTTAAGHAAVTDQRRRLAEAEDHLLAGLDREEDRRAFRSLLSRLATRVEVADAGRDACAAGPQADPAGAIAADRGAAR